MYISYLVFVVLSIRNIRGGIMATVTHIVTVTEDSERSFLVTVSRDQMRGRGDFWTVKIQSEGDDNPLGWSGQVYVNYDVVDAQLESKYREPRLARLLSEAVHRCVVMFTDPP